MKIRIAARSSDLARIQAISVGEAIRKSSANSPGGPIEIEYAFRQSLGDIHQGDPLWKMPEKGVFTEDFRADLLSGACDMVVHSWKDLPIDSRPETTIAATMARADLRDLLLFKRPSAERLLSTDGSKHVRILSSSPRRAYNLGPFLGDHLPSHSGSSEKATIEFIPVRGNVPTRVRKWLEGEEDGLIVAKAALDRLLETDQLFNPGDSRDEWASVREFLRGALRNALWMVLPISENPPAAAQGALAIEIRADREDLRAPLAAIHSEEAFRAVCLEREVLKGYGGGCHQKIGVAVLPRSYGTVFSLRGVTDQGVILREFSLRPPEGARQPFPRVEQGRFWPETDADRIHAFDRVPLNPKNPGGDLWVSRTDALPASWKVDFSQMVWTSGLETWKKLAARGVWVSGSSEGLGESEATRVDTLLKAQRGRPSGFTKLSHTEGFPGELPILATYELRPSGVDFEKMRAQWAGKTHFFWMSGSLFEYCLEKAPELRSAYHSCGPGNTYAILTRILGTARPIGVFLGIDEWKKEILR